MAEPTFDDAVKFLRDSYIHRDLADRLEERFRPQPINLQLTKAELDTLTRILYRVGGDPDKTRRGHADTILAKAEKLGGSHAGDDITGGISFN